MSDAALLEQVRNFTVDLIEEAGGLVDWPEGCEAGEAFVPGPLSATLGQSTETFSLGTDGDKPGLALNLAGDFLSLTGKALEQFVPRRGRFALPDISVRKSDFQQAVDTSFGWQNARARIKQVNFASIHYHSWWFHAQLRSDDTWESLFQTIVNSQSGLEVSLGGVFDSLQSVSDITLETDPNATLQSAARVTKLKVVASAADFLVRADQRLQRDRKRVREYYGSMLREARKPNRRTKTALSDSEIADRERAVKLEMQRKLTELDDRSAIGGSLHAVAFADILIPTAIVDLEIQRKASKRDFQIFWNGVLRKFEPLRCHKCHSGSFNLWFTNDDVEPICNACH